MPRYQITWVSSEGVGLGQVVRTTPAGILEIIKLMNERSYKSVDPSKQYWYKELAPTGESKGTSK